MADRDITIPSGPDTTGGMPPVDPVVPAEGAEAPLPPSAVESTGIFDVLPDAAATYQPQAQAQPVADHPAEPRPAVAAEEDVERFLAGGDEPADDQPQVIESVQGSFAALKDSIGQGRELKAREKEREELGERIKADREELADRDYIMANYSAVVAEQDDIIARDTQQRDAQKAELAQLTADVDEAADALDRMRDYHDMQLQPLETDLGRARATAEQAKNDERSRKSELAAAEKEADRAEGGDSTVASAKVKVLQDAFDEAVARSNAAKEALEQAQVAYDDARQQVEQAEAPLERSIEDKNAQIEELKESVARLGESISAARKRRQYCDSVYQYPDETSKLRSAVESDEALARRMDDDNDALRGQLAESKQKARTAKLAIAGIVVLVVVILIAVIYFMTRG